MFLCSFVAHSCELQVTGRRCAAAWCHGSCSPNSTVEGALNMFTEPTRSPTRRYPCPPDFLPFRPTHLQTCSSPPSIPFRSTIHLLHPPPSPRLMFFVAPRPRIARQHHPLLTQLLPPTPCQPTYPMHFQVGQPPEPKRCHCFRKLCKTIGFVF